MFNYNREIYEEIMEKVSKEVKKALRECDGADCGGAAPSVEVGATYNNAFNTVGVGDIVPAGINTLGSGDRFDNFYPGSDNKKKSKKRKIKIYSKK